MRHVPRPSAPAARPLLITLLAVLGLGLGLTLLWQSREEGTEPEDRADGTEVDAELWGVLLRQRNGERRWRLRADHAAHHPGPGVTRLRPVHLEVLRPEGRPLTAEARHGRIADTDHTVTLIDEVVVVDPEGYRLTTDTLRYLPQADRAETSDPVSVTADFGNTEGIGATLWTEERRVRLHRQVSTILWRRPADAS